MNSPERVRLIDKDGRPFLFDGHCLITTVYFRDKYGCHLIFPSSSWFEVPNLIENIEVIKIE